MEKETRNASAFNFQQPGKTSKTKKRLKTRLHRNLSKIGCYFVEDNVSKI